MPATVERAAAPAQPAVIAALPFVASAHEHVEPAFSFSVTPTANTQQIDPKDIPASGYARYLYLEVIFSGGAGGTLTADAPWNVFQSIGISDVNGGNIFGPMSGYSAYITNLLGGYANRSNPLDSPWFSGSAPNPTFFLRIPWEITRKNGLGAVANQNSSANYKFTCTINTIAAMTSVAWTTTPVVTVNAYLEAWTLPASMDSKNRPQAQVPPLLGTSQIWSTRTNQSIAAGDNTTAFTRLGNYVRLWAFIARNASGVRVDTVMPDPMEFRWDGITIRKQTQRYAQQDLYEKTNGVVTRPTGVFCIPFNHGGQVADFGDEDPDLWLPTSGTSRIELAGVSAVAGSIEVLTCEVAPVEQDQTQRYIVPNANDPVTVTA